MIIQSISDEKLRIIYQYLFTYCKKNKVKLSCKSFRLNDSSEAIIVFSDYKRFGSFGFDSKKKPKCLILDSQIYYRSRLEGFSDQQIFSEDFLDNPFREVDFLNLASHLIGK